MSVTTENTAMKAKDQGRFIGIAQRIDDYNHRIGGVTHDLIIVNTKIDGPTPSDPPNAPVEGRNEASTESVLDLFNRLLNETCENLEALEAETQRLNSLF